MARSTRIDWPGGVWAVTVTAGMACVWVGLSVLADAAVDVDVAAADSAPCANAGAAIANSRDEAEAIRRRGRRGQK
ncbi:hypothetical protein BGC_32070 [Burkholderia sp. 3C]